MASIYPDHGLGGKNGEITDAIFEDSLEVARDLGHTLLHSSLNDIVENVNAPVNSRMVFNDLTWKRDRQVEVEISKDQALVKDDNGRIIGCYTYLEVCVRRCSRVRIYREWSGRIHSYYGFDFRRYHAS